MTLTLTPSLLLIAFAAGLIVLPGATSAHAASPAPASPQAPGWMTSSQATLEKELAAKYGEPSRERLRRGLAQVAGLWRAEDGDQAAFERFARENFYGDPAVLDAFFARMEFMAESLDGHMLEVSRDLRKQNDLALGPIQPFDDVMAGWDPSAHVTDDLFDNKLAFTVLLNFPLTTLRQRLAEGDGWTRRQWAETRLAERYSKRIPAEVNLAISQARADAAKYIAQYNIWMHHVLNEKGERLFPAKLRLLSHWNLRDEIKAQYADPKAGLPRQRLVQKVMERIVTQTIPAAVVDSPFVDWDPVRNEVKPSPVNDSGSPPPAGTGAASVVSSAREPDTRYATLLLTFQASRKEDPYSPSAPTLIARGFDEIRQIPEERVRKIFEDVLSSPLMGEVARLVERRLGRKLEPFDIWYNGFRARSAYSESQLDEAVRKRYPTVEAYQKDIPRLLAGLGFSPDKAAFLEANIVVDPARGSGHALGAQWRGDKAHLRTRFEKDGMNYKGYNIAVHEMGHTVEQNFSLHEVDHYTLSGVPNTAFTEALAFVFQGHDLELLGMTKPDAESRALDTLDTYWGTCEIAGVALVDMAVWRYMYDHPSTTPGELREATVAIAKDVWNRYFAPHIGVKDVVLLGIYSHMIDSFLYLPDYPLGHLIAFQVEQQMEKAGAIGPEFERMAVTGNVTPDLWMKKATGAPVGPEALLTATRRALDQLGRLPKKS